MFQLWHKELRAGSCAHTGASKFTGETAPPEASVDLAAGGGEKSLGGDYQGMGFTLGGPVTPPHLDILPLFNLERRLSIRRPKT